jgi:hypothetical protein
MKRFRLIFLLAVFFVGCKKHGGDGNISPSPPPEKAILSLPAANAACTTGANPTSTQSSVTFTWNASANTDSYELDIKNLLDNSIIRLTTSQTQEITSLALNTPYAWFILSKSKHNSTTAQSDTWKFYNSGPGIVSFAPFPAEITSPLFGQQLTAASGTMDLIWKGSSVNNDIKSYDVYFGVNSDPALYKSDVSDMFLNGLPVTTGNTYYWKIVTWDQKNNNSDSGVFQFSVK